MKLKRYTAEIPFNGGVIITRIGIIRHGSTAWNKEGRAQGSSDIPLDEEGISESYKLAERLNIENWDIVYSSNFLRATQTAEIIRNRMGIQIHFDSRLREVGGGKIEGTTEHERILQWGNNWRELDLGIESAESVILRGLSFIEEIHYKHESKNILIVSHGAFIKYLLNELAAVSMQESPRNTAITILVKSTNGWDVEIYNCSRHLTD